MDSELLDKMVVEIKEEHTNSIRQAERMRENADLKYQNQMDLINKLRSQVKNENGAQENERTKPSEHLINGDGNGEDQKDDSADVTQLFGMTESVKRYIKDLPIDYNVTMPKTYDFLIEKYPELKQRTVGNLRAQISSTLHKLTKQKFLILFSKGNSSEPHIYKRNPTADVSLF